MTTPIQGLRHEAKEGLYGALRRLEGRPGMPKDEQVTNLTEALARVDEVKVVLAQAKELAETRDFDAYLAEKATVKVAEPDYYGGEPYDEDEEDDEF